jgi:hypothetical protein
MSWTFQPYSTATGALVNYDKVSRPIPQDDWWKDTKYPKSGKFLPPVLGTVGKPGPYLPVDSRTFQIGIANAPRTLSRSSSQTMTGSFVLGGSPHRMYSAGSVPLISSDWFYEKAKSEMLASKAETQKEVA